MRDYEFEPFIPWYTSETATWLCMSLASRGALASLAMRWNKRGEIPLSQGLPSLAILLRADWSELGPAIEALLIVGKITWDEERKVLCDPEYFQRKRPEPMSGAERQQRYRARHQSRDESDNSASRDESNGKRGEERRGEENRKERESESARARVDLVLGEGDRAAAQSVIDPSGETVDIGAEWAKYLADREARGRPVSSADWRGWVLKAIGFAKRERMRESDRKAAAQARREPPPTPKQTPEQAKRFADAIVAKMRELKVGGQ